jgi:DNA-binding transcriptional regulator YhcF (GntR family)
MISVAAAGRRSAVTQDEIAARLRRLVVGGVHLGRIAAGQRLPSTRLLAAELGVDPRRITRAYHRLVVEGLVDLRPRSGFYVAAPRRGWDGRENGHVAELDWAVNALTAAWELGLRPLEAVERLRASVKSRPLTAVCIECNEDQLHGLGLELEADYGLNTRRVHVDDLVNGATGSAGGGALLSGADLIVTTTFHAATVRSMAAAIRTPMLAVTVRSDLLGHIERALVGEDVFLVGSDARFTEKILAMFAQHDSGNRLHVLVAGRDDVSVVPEGAPLYITRRARQVLGNHPVVRRVPPVPSVFSPESRRELLTAMAQANAGSAAHGRATGQPG